jgi:hypothetical protein
MPTADGVESVLVRIVLLPHGRRQPARRSLSVAQDLPRGVPLILEGIVTTLNADGSPNIAPMGALVDERMRQLALRPYRTAATYVNLRRTGQGVFHVTDDVELLARAAVGRLERLPALMRAHKVDGVVLTDTCRWYELRVSQLDDRAERTTITCEVVGSGRVRDFLGFNRAKHAVLEAAILATRLTQLPADSICAEFRRLAVIVDKTAGPQERRAFQFLDEYVGAALGQ